MATIDGDAVAALTGLRQLPVFTELAGIYGPGHGAGLDGTPVRSHDGSTRMAFAWLVDSGNRYFYVDYYPAGQLWKWRVHSGGPAGRVRFDQMTPVPPGQAALRAAAAGSGLLPALEPAADVMVDAILDVLAPWQDLPPGLGELGTAVRVPLIRVMHDGQPVVPSEEWLRALAGQVVTVIRTARR